MKTLLTLLFIPALLATAQNAAPGTRNALEQAAAPTPGLDDASLLADSPKVFPRKGPLPLLYPPNLSMLDEEAETDYFIFSAPLEHTQTRLEGSMSSASLARLPPTPTASRRR